MNVTVNSNFDKGRNRFRPNRSRRAAEMLTNDNRDEALEFLARRPLHAVIMSGWIREHGVLSPQHRGSFYGWRDSEDSLGGVALIGRNTLFEVRSDDAIAAFAKQARKCPDIRMVFAREDELGKFWRQFGGISPMPALTRHHLITTTTGGRSEEIEIVEDLRIATMDDLDKVAEAHAQMVQTETGSNPLATDAHGFRMRCAQRIEEGKVWVWIKDGELLFKTDIVSVTPEAIYIEGLWVNPNQRGRGHSARGLISMCQKLLTGSNAICGFLDEAHTIAQALYRRSGFVGIDKYARIYI